MICGVGIDVVDVARFRAAMDRWGERLTRRLFTEGELSYCFSQRRPEVHLAARFAAKISLFKALGRSLRFTDVEITRSDDGRPGICAVGLPEDIRVDVSIAHDAGISLAQSVVERVKG